MRPPLEEILARMPELCSKILPASRALVLLQTSKTMRTAVKDSGAVVKVRSVVTFRNGPELNFVSVRAIKG